jgi:hypothetical protein
MMFFRDRHNFCFVRAEYLLTILKRYLEHSTQTVMPFID